MDRHSSVREGRGRTWAKVILLGEHSVVYGHPAVALPLHDLRMRATAVPVPGPSRLCSLDYRGPIDRSGPRFACVARAFDKAREFSGRLGQSFEITTRSDFPHARGLGSSAAASGAVIRAVLDACRRDASADELFALTQMAERVAHGNPSGLDAAATSSSSPIRFQGGRMRPVSQRIAHAHLVIADSGVQGSTREAVSGLRRCYEQDAEGTGPLIDGLGALARTAITALHDGDAPAPPLPGDHDVPLVAQQLVGPEGPGRARCPGLHRERHADAPLPPVHWGLGPAGGAPADDCVAPPPVEAAPLGPHEHRARVLGQGGVPQVLAPWGHQARSGRAGRVVAHRPILLP